jgi:hypothetical protein
VSAFEKEDSEKSLSTVVHEEVIRINVIEPADTITDDTTINIPSKVA